MTTPPETDATAASEEARRHLDPARLAPSAAMLGAHIALSAAIEHERVTGSEHDQRTMDLLLRLFLSPNGAMRAVDLSRQLLVSASHMSRVIDRVEARGLVSRGPDPDDRRANLVSITDAGKLAVADMAPKMAAVLDQAIHRVLSPAEITTLIDLLGRVEAAARELV